MTDSLELSYKWLRATMWVWGMEPKSSFKASTLNCWAIFLAPKLIILRIIWNCMVVLILLQFQACTVFVSVDLDFSEA